MLLKRFLTNPNRINKQFFLFNVNFLSRQIKIFTFTKSTFCTDKIEKTKNLTATSYYRQYILSKPESYSDFSDTLALKREIESDTESFKLLSNLLNNLEENLTSDELKETLAVEFDCNVNEICKKILFIGNTILNEKMQRLIIHKLDIILWKKTFTLDELLKILIAFNLSNFSNRSSFAKNKVLKFFKKIQNLSPAQVVQLFFIIPEKDFSDDGNKYNILSYVNHSISLFNTDEVGIITRGLKLGNFILGHHNLYNTIIGRAIEDIENIHSVPLQSICMAVFKLCRSCKSKLILNLQEKSIPYVQNLSVPALIELSELGIRAECINSSFWETVIRKYKENINNLSLFYILRIQKQAIIYKTKDKELLKLIVEKFEKNKNNENQLEEFVYLLCNLTYCNLYPKDLFDLVFSDEFISKKVLSSKANGKLKLSWWILHCSLEIEKPEYLNYELNVRKRIKLQKHFQFSLWNVEKIIHRNYVNFYKKIGDYLKNLYGENAVASTACLPQHNTGFILRLNKYLEAQPIPENFLLSGRGYVKKPLDDNNYWIFLNLIAFNQYGVDGVTILEHHPTQYRQLKAVGYIPVMIPIQLYHNHVKKNTQDSFITELIQNSIKEEAVLKN